MSTTPKKISYKTMRKNQTLNGFMESGEEENESD